MFVPSQPIFSFTRTLTYLFFSKLSRRQEQQDNSRNASKTLLNARRLLQRWQEELNRNQPTKDANASGIGVLLYFTNTT